MMCVCGGEGGGGGAWLCVFHEFSEIMAFDRGLKTFCQFFIHSQTLTKTMLAFLIF